MEFEKLSEKALASYEKYYFENICGISVGERERFSTPLPQIEGLHFACVQDTVERLTEGDRGARLSTLQWRNFIFAPIDRSMAPRHIYERVFDELRDVV